MSNKKNLTALSTCVETFPWARGEGEINLDIDLDAFTEEYFREAARRQREKLSSASPLEKAIELVNVDVAEPEPIVAIEDTKKEVTMQDIWDQAAMMRAKQKDVFIDMLLAGSEPHQGSPLRGWDAQINDNPIELNEISLRKLSPSALEAMWEFCAEKIRTVKKTTSKTTPSTTNVGSTEDQELAHTG